MLLHSFTLSPSHVMGHRASAYELATHVSCPSARTTLFVQNNYNDDVSPILFPPSATWSAIVPLYSREPIKEVPLLMKDGCDAAISCSLCFRTPDVTVVLDPRRTGTTKGKHNPPPWIFQKRSFRKLAGPCGPSHAFQRSNGSPSNTGGKLGISPSSSVSRANLEDCSGPQVP